jgi:succinate dehydrogenase / fumarate reductase cytochrome b subunit
MEQFTRLLKTTIGSKTLIGFTGLAFAGFLVAHMAGNMLIFVGPEAYNKYGHALVSNPAIYIAEAGLVAIFVAHLVKALQLAYLNNQARPQKYKVAASGEKGTSAVQKTLWAQGLLILVFVGLHLNTFKYGTLYDVTYDGETIRDLHRLVVEVFQSPAYVGGYLVALLVIGFHVKHGVASAFQTLGVNHPKYTPMIKTISLLYTVVVVGGFIAQPIYVFLFHKGS